MQIGYVNVFVSDFARALVFYRDVLKLPVQYADAQFRYASFAAGAIRLGINQPGQDQMHLVGRHTGVGLMVSDLDARHAELAAVGVRFAMPPTRQPWGGYMALFGDPDGNIFYLDQISA